MVSKDRQTLNHHFNTVLSACAMSKFLTMTLVDWHPFLANLRQ